MTQLVAVLWSGVVGGAETFSIALARELRQQGVSIGFLFVGDPEPLAGELRRLGVQYETIEIPRGRDIVRHPVRLARTARRLGGDGALLIQPGLLAAVLKAGGYRGRIVAVNHGEPLHEQRGMLARAKRAVSENGGRWATHVEVAVSDAVFCALQKRRHARRLVRIYNGVNLELFMPSPNNARRTALTIGWAGRLVRGKGVEDLIAAAKILRERSPVLVRIAGEGPLRRSLEAAGHDECVRFEGAVGDMPAFWQSCDIAAMPSSSLVESFGMATAEAMACGLPVVASRLGALPELVQDGHAGILCEPGNRAELAAALAQYAGDTALRRAHGRNARRVCEKRFDIRDCARRYRTLFEDQSP